MIFLALLVFMSRSRSDYCYVTREQRKARSVWRSCRKNHFCFFVGFCSGGWLAGVHCCFRGSSAKTNKIHPPEIYALYWLSHGGESVCLAPTTNFRLIYLRFFVCVFSGVLCGCMLSPAPCICYKNGAVNNCLCISERMGNGRSYHWQIHPSTSESVIRPNFGARTWCSYDNAASRRTT